MKNCKNFFFFCNNKKHRSSSKLCKKKFNDVKRRLLNNCTKNLRVENSKYIEAIIVIDRMPNQCRKKLQINSKVFISHHNLDLRQKF